MTATEKDRCHTRGAHFRIFGYALFSGLSLTIAQAGGLWLGGLIILPAIGLKSPSYVLWLVAVAVWDAMGYWGMWNSRVFDKYIREERGNALPPGVRVDVKVVEVPRQPERDEVNR